VGTTPSPDEALIAASAAFDTAVNNLMPRIFGLVNGSKLEGEMTKFVVDTQMDIPNDWLAFPVQGNPMSDEVENRGFYKSMSLCAMFCSFNLILWIRVKSRRL
jgi:hypothetical protein